MSRSYRKNPVRWQCCNSCKKEKQIYNRRMRHNNKLILKDYNDSTVLQVHKRDGLSWWDWACDGKGDLWVYKENILILDAEELEWYKKFIRK